MSTKGISPAEKATNAIQSGNSDILKQIFTETPEIIEVYTSKGDTLLGLACRVATSQIAIPPVLATKNQSLVIETILEAGANPNVCTKEGWCPLHTVAMSGNIDIAKRLISAGANTKGNLYQCKGGSPLALALFYAKTEMGEFLAKPPIPDNLRHAAALGRSLDHFFNGNDLKSKATEGLDFYRPLKVFPEWERNFSRQEVLDETLSWASRNNQISAMLNLVERGAKVNSNAYRGTPLLWAIYSDSVEAATFLLDHGADPNLKHNFGGEGHGLNATAIHLASQFGSLKCIALLLRHGADPNIIDGAHGGNALGWAKHGGSTDAVELLKNWKGS